jgi:hypothetical protein
VASRVLINILILGGAAFCVSLAIEKYYAGRLKWLTVFLLSLAIAVIATRPGILLYPLPALTEPLSPKQLGVLLWGGLLSGIVMSGVCIFFRLVQAVLIKWMS